MLIYFNAILNIYGMECDFIYYVRLIIHSYTIRYTNKVLDIFVSV